MESFSDRAKGFEAKFKRDQELAFRITARRNKLFGLWAATRLGLPAGDAAQAYAMTVIAADFEAPGDDDVIRKVLADLVDKGIAVTEAELRTELARADAEARAQLSASWDEGRTQNQPGQLAAVSAIDTAPLTLVFGGGTALSWAHRLIRRMSEDIDLRIVGEEPGRGTLRHLTEHGVMEAARLYESLSRDLTTHGADGLFRPTQVDELMALREQLRRAAPAVWLDGRLPISLGVEKASFED
jgi:hypothetical protein